jgi:hypothetical protein
MIRVRFWEWDAKVGPWIEPGKVPTHPAMQAGTTGDVWEISELLRDIVECRMQDEDNPPQPEHQPPQPEPEPRRQPYEPLPPQEPDWFRRNAPGLPPKEDPLRKIEER